MNGQRHDAVTEQAIAWMVLLQSGRAGAGDNAQLEQWLQADSLHQQAWERIQGVLQGRFGTLRQLERRVPGAVDGVKALLVEDGVNRRALLRGVAGLGVLGGGLWLCSRTPLAQSWMADLSTGTAERRNFALQDGSRLTLNAASAVDFDQDNGQRLLRLRRGELLVQVAANPARPFIVRSAGGDVRALGTRFMVRREDSGSRVIVLEHSVLLTSESGQSLILREGQSALLQPGAITPASTDQGYRLDWLEGRLRVVDEPLATVIDALRPYHPGLLQLAAEVGELRVMGEFSLDHPQQTLTTLSETLPISVRRLGPWLTFIGKKNG